MLVITYIQQFDIKEVLLLNCITEFVQKKLNLVFQGLFRILE